MGASPQIATHSDGSIHLVYERSGQIFYRLDEGSGFGSEALVSGTVATATAPALAVDFFGAPHAIFESQGDVYFTRAGAGDVFLTPINVSSSMDDSTEPRIRLVGGSVVILYREANDLWETAGVGAEAFRVRREGASLYLINLSLAVVNGLPVACTMVI